MTDAQIQATIDACKAAGADPLKVEWNDLKQVLSNILTQVTLTDLGTPTAGHIPKFIGGGWTTGPDQTADAGTGADIDTTLSIGDVTERQIYWDKTITPPTVEGAAVSHRWMQFKSLTKAHTSGPTKSANFNWWHAATKQGTTVNEVMHFGWNVGNGGGPDDGAIPGIGESWESNYSPEGVRIVEKHEFYITPPEFSLPSTQIRLSSYTINTASGNIDYYKTIGRFYLKLPYAGGYETTYFMVAGAANGAKMDLMKFDGSCQMTFELDKTNGMTLAGAGFDPGHEFFSIYGFQGINLNNLADYTGFTRVKGGDLEAYNGAGVGLGLSRLGSTNYPFRGIAWKDKAGFPDASEIDHGFWQMWHNTTTGENRLYVNRYGTLKYITIP